MPAHAHVRGFEPDDFSRLPREPREHTRQGRVVRPIDDEQLERGACGGGGLAGFNRLDVAEVGDEQEAIHREHDDGRATVEVGGVQDIRRRGDHQGLNPVVDHRPANRLMTNVKRAARRV